MILELINRVGVKGSLTDADGLAFDLVAFVCQSLALLVYFLEYLQVLTEPLTAALIHVEYVNILLVHFLTSLLAKIEPTEF